MPIPNYPLDLTATLPSNHITGEVHVITTPQSRFFVPVGGPFFTQSMILRNNVTNALLMPNNDFKILHHHAEGSAATGKNVCAIIYITNPLIASVNLEYQCVGGVYSDTSDIIRQMVVDHPLDPDQPQLIGWEQVFGQPSQYPSSAHQHLANQFWGYGDLVASIEQLRVAVASGDNAAMAAIYRYIELMINNNNYLTADDLNGLLQTPDTFIKTHPTYNALRNRADFSDNLPVVYMTIGKVTTSDGLGMMFRWEPASMVDDDDHHVIRPTNRLVTEPGRLVSMLWAENMLRPVLDTLGRRIETNGTVTADLGVVNRIELVSMNSLITPGDYWIHSNCTDRPTNVETLALKVWRESDTAIGQQAQCLYSTENYPHNRQGITYSRASLDGGATWYPWHETFTVSRAVANGLDVDLATTNATNADLNTLVRTGKYWFGNTNANRPEYNPGLYMEYAQLEVVCLNSSDVMQRAFNTSLEAYRYGYGGGAYAGHSWAPWEFRAARNGDTTQAFAMFSHPSNLIDGTHGINAWYLSTQFAAPLWLRLTNAGIDADLAVTNSVHGADLDDILNPCEVYYTPSTGNRPSPYGLLKVWRESWNVVYQLAHSSDNNLHYRYGSFYSGIWHWSAWSRSATAAEMTSAIAAATAGVTPYEYMSVNPTVGGVSTVYHYVTTGARFLAIAISAPGGGGGAGGWAAGGEGGGGGAGGFGQLVVEGNLDGFFVVTVQYGDNAPGPLGGQGMDSWGTAAYNNPSSVATVYTAGGTAVLQMTVTAGQTGGTADSQWNGDGVSNGGGAGASGSASVWRNPGYSRRAIVHTFMSDTANVQATAGGYNANGALGQGGTIATGARNGDGGNPNNDGHGGQGGLHQAGSGALGSTGGYGAVRVVWH